MKNTSTLWIDKIPLNGFLEMKATWKLLTDLEWKILIENKYTKEEALKILSDFYSVSENELLNKFVNLRESQNQENDFNKEWNYKEINEFVKFSIDKVNWEVFTTLRIFSNDNEFNFNAQTWTHRIIEMKI